MEIYITKKLYAHFLLGLRSFAWAADNAAKELWQAGSFLRFPQKNT